MTGFRDIYHEAVIQLKYDKESEYLSAIDTQSQKSLIVEKHWWLGWKEFHPDTKIWKK